MFSIFFRNPIDILSYSINNETSRKTRKEKTTMIITVTKKQEKVAVIRDGGEITGIYQTGVEAQAHAKSVTKGCAKKDFISCRWELFDAVQNEIKPLAQAIKSMNFTKENCGYNAITNQEKAWICQFASI